MATAEIELSEQQSEQAVEHVKAMQQQAMKLRKEEILGAVSTMIAEHNAWADNPDAPEVPTQRMEYAIDAAILECEHGDIPGDCRQLITAMEVLSAEWSQYKSGKWDHRNRPMPTFWDAFRDVMSARQGATVSVFRSIEPVSELIRQKVSHQQIATIYGGDKGPFMVDGVLRVDLILSEAEKPGSVVPEGWTHPDEEESKARQAENLRGKLAVLQSRDSRSVDDQPEEATIEQMIREGANVDQIAAVKGVSKEEVRDVAKQCGLQALEREILTGNVRSPYDPKADSDAGDAEVSAVETASSSQLSSELPDQPQQQAAEQQPESQAEPVDDFFEAEDGDAVVEIAGDGGAESITDGELNMLIVDEHARNPDVGSPELASILSEHTGTTVTPQRVSEVLREHKRQQSQEQQPEIARQQ